MSNVERSTVYFHGMSYSHSVINCIYWKIACTPIVCERVRESWRAFHIRICCCEMRAVRRQHRQQPWPKPQSLVAIKEIGNSHRVPWYMMRASTSPKHMPHKVHFQLTFGKNLNISLLLNQSVCRVFVRCAIRRDGSELWWIGDYCEWMKQEDSMPMSIQKSTRLGRYMASFSCFFFICMPFRSHWQNLKILMRRRRLNEKKRTIWLTLEI